MRFVRSLRHLGEVERRFGKLLRLENFGGVASVEQPLSGTSQKARKVLATIEYRWNLDQAHCAASAGLLILFSVIDESPTLTSSAGGRALAAGGVSG